MWAKFSRTNRTRAPAILQLAGQLARGVERVDVDDVETCREHAEQDRRIGHHVGKHDGDPVALLEPLLLQPCVDRRRGRAHLSIGKARAEALRSRAIREVGNARAEEIGERREFALVDRVRDAGRVEFQPELGLPGPPRSPELRLPAWRSSCFPSCLHPMTRLAPLLIPRRSGPRSEARNPSTLRLQNARTASDHGFRARACRHAPEWRRGWRPQCAAAFACS